MKHEDKIALCETLKNAPSKEKALEELLKFADQFDKTHQQRTKELYKKDKEAIKVSNNREIQS